MNAGKDWSDEENAATVSAYLDMLEQELADQPYVKARFRRRLVDMFGRSEAACEMKFANISAVLRDQRCIYIQGYKPRGNFQHSLADEVAAQLDSRPYMYELMRQKADEKATPRSDVSWKLDALPTRPLIDLSGYQGHRGYHTDFVALEARNRSLGAAGEKAVFDRERELLIAANRQDLAERVRHVSKEDGDGLGYDIHSYSPQGRDRLIEVKTTTRDIEWPMIVSRNEVQVSAEHPDDYVLARIYQYKADRIGLYELPGAIEATCDLEPESYKALPKVSG